MLLQRRIPQHVFDSKSQQGLELKKVEATYESILLKESKFPRADQANSHIESWVDQVMANWSVMCGDTWQNEDLGEGGKASLGRGVLEVGRFLECLTFCAHDVRRRKIALTVPHTDPL